MSHTFTTLMRRLSRAGFKRDFAQVAILPEWWDETCTADADLLPEAEIRVARFLGLPLSAVRNTDAALAFPTYPGAQLRRVRDVNRDRLAPAIHSAARIAEAVVRNLGAPLPAPAVPPADGLAWRQLITRSGSALTLDEILDDLWGRGIPVVTIETLPAPSFQGAVFVVDGRPVILVGHKHDEPGRVAFLVAHEVGHISAGDCQHDQPVVDEEDEVLDDDATEQNADRYARRVLVGSDAVPSIAGDSYKSIASNALRLERESGADASIAIFAWASRTGDYATASMAVKALYRGSGAMRKLRTHLQRHVDPETASESDRGLLRCLSGDLADAAAG
jgi:hypothetical protein